MASISDQEFDLLLARTGVNLPPVERARLKTIYENLRPALNTLHEVDVDAHEVAGDFSPDWGAE